MRNRLDAWTQHVEHPGREAAAAMRANLTAERRVMEEAHNLQSAKARGDKAGIVAAQAALRQAWETDVRRKGGHPEDFIPDLPNAKVVPIYSFYGYGDIKTTGKKLLIMAIILSTIAYAWKRFVS